MPDFLQTTFVLPAVEVAPTLGHDAPMRMILAVTFGAEVVGVGVEVDVDEQAVQSIPTAFRASPGLSACVPSPNAWPVRAV